jgi:hypothetical protein
MMKHFEKKEPMGTVWVDERLKNVPIPFNMRDIEEGKTVVPRGMRMPLPDSKTIRFYLHWDGKSRGNDLDLNARFYTATGQDSQTLYYGTTGLKFANGISRHVFAAHSGDVRHVMGPCAEYVDIDIAEAIAAGFKYVVLSAEDYAGRGFKHWDTTVGFMSRDYPEAGEIFVPKTVENSIRLTSDDTTMIIAMFDLETKEYVMIQEARYGLPTPAAGQSISDVLAEYIDPPVLSMYDIIEMHVKARSGKIGDSTEKADEVFLFENFLDYAAIGKWLED